MPNTNQLIIRTALLIVSLYAVNVVANNNEEYSTNTELFTLPEHGELKIEVPTLWEYRYTTIDNASPPFLTFYMHDKNNKEIFQLNISVLWEDGYERDIISSDFIYSLVYEAGKNTLSESDQSEIILTEIKGTYGNGFLFDLSDSDAKQDEYKFLTQGGLAVGKLLLLFSLFSNDDQMILRELMLRTIKSAKHQYRTDV